ncbi:hypothetical protein Rleg4DRAFT_4547 [Rhizobium leguminosarum bv. trifolii WSM2297]|uniref:Uncharacterized protein n=1 Tax=Rhizobium leguminosarum bv. trifolii WSM2297 TaxID=754762 RepID=J0WC93_RHILT|nr:hypothetical protein Rleg4DRAFT_4547 [Rhizobium leguminosarum bv. trifolii WSM2297]
METYETGENGPSSACRHLLPVNGAKGCAATSPFPSNLSQGTSPLPVLRGEG